MTTDEVMEQIQSNKDCDQVTIEQVVAALITKLANTGLLHSSQVDDIVAGGDQE